MTYEQFWKNGIDIFYTYYLAYERKVENSHREMDTSAWYIGQYFVEALKSTPIMPLGLLSEKDLRKVCGKYSNKPHWKIEYDKTHIVDINKNVTRYKPPSQNDIQSYNERLSKIKKK